MQEFPQLVTNDKFSFQYKLCGSGWAEARIQHGQVDLTMTASYLHDSLRELAIAAKTISRGSGETRVVFMDEPGEHQLFLRREPSSSDVHYSVTWFNDWDSWGMRRIKGSRQLCDGVVSVRRFVQQVHALLWSLFSRLGESEYRAQWVEHPFPTKEMEEL